MKVKPRSSKEWSKSSSLIERGHMEVDPVVQRLGTPEDSRHKQLGSRTPEGPKAGVHLNH
jgi:hypothetical protein